MATLIAKTVNDAREELRERWKDGKVTKCPNCGCTAQDWRDAGDRLVMRCEDCGARETARYDPFERPEYYD